MLLLKMALEPVRSRLFFFSIGLISAINLVGCQPPLVSIEAIASKKTNSSVYITGKVIHIAPFVANAAYQLQDDTGTIWVVTQQTPAPIGQTISIEGKIEYQSLPFAERDLGDFYLIELKRLPTSLDSTNKPN